MKTLNFIEKAPLPKSSTSFAIIMRAKRSEEPPGIARFSFEDCRREHARLIL